MRAAVDLVGGEAGVEAVGDADEAVRVEVERGGGALQPLGAADDDPLAARRPVADPLGPALGVRPARRGAGGDPLQHQQLGAVDVAEHRDLGEGARGRLAERGQVVEVEEVGVGGAGQPQLPHPGLDLELEGLVVEGGEDRVLGIGAILVGAVHRRGAGGAVEVKRVVAAQRGREVDRSQVEPGVEALRPGRARRGRSGSRRAP